MRTFTEWIGALIISLYPKRRVQGIRVIFTDLAVDKMECSRRLNRAIELMRATGTQYEALLGRIRFIVVWPGNTTFADGAGGVHVASEAVLGIDDLALASVLIHEAVHHRITARGIRYDPSCRERIERICIKVQARFLRSNPEPGEQMAREAEAVLAIPWWTPEQREADLDELFSQHALPTWLKGIVRRS